MRALAGEDGPRDIEAADAEDCYVTSDSATLRLTAEPGEYQVEWLLPGATGEITRLRGDLDLAPDKPPRGNAYGAVPAQYTQAGTSQFMSFPQRYDASVIVGTAVSGLTILLLDAQVEIWFDNRAVITARAALVSRSGWTGGVPVIKALTVQVEGLDAIAGVPPVSKAELPSNRDEGRRYLDWSWEAVGNPDSTQRWSDSNATVTLSFPSSVSPPNGFFFRVSFSPTVRIELRESRPLVDVFRVWIEPLRRIVALGTARQEKITLATVDAQSESGETVNFQVFGSALYQAPYVSDSNVALKVKRSFAIAPDDMSLLALLRQWQHLESEHHPLLETYGAMMYAPAQHPRNRFLLVVQALEGLHGYETRDVRAARVEQHRLRRSAVLAETEGMLSAESVRFLKRHLAARPASSLQQVLQETLATAPVDIEPLLAVSDLVSDVMQDSRHSTNTYDALRLIRNDLAHGTRGYDVRAVHEVAELLEGVVRAHMLRILGCSIEAQQRDQERLQT